MKFAKSTKLIKWTYRQIVFMIVQVYAYIHNSHIPRLLAGLAAPDSFEMDITYMLPQLGL